MKPCNSESTTSGEGFLLEDYNKLGESRLTEIVACGGFTGFSLLLPILYLFRARPGVIKPLLRLSAAIDESLGDRRYWQKFTLHRWMLLRRLD